MDRERAIAIARALADGVDPVTGEVFPPDSPYSQPDIVRALYTLVLDAQARSTPTSARRKPPRPTTEGQEAGWQPWAREEDERLAATWNSGDQNISSLAREHRRSRGAITSRLKKLGLLIEATNGPGR